jgi:hypothetical protein
MTGTASQDQASDGTCLNWPLWSLVPLSSAGWMALRSLAWYADDPPDHSKCTRCSHCVQRLAPGPSLCEPGSSWTSGSFSGSRRHRWSGVAASAWSARTPVGAAERCAYRRGSGSLVRASLFPLRAAGARFLTGGNHRGWCSPAFLNCP